MIGLPGREYERDEMGADALLERLRSEERAVTVRTFRRGASFLCRTVMGVWVAAVIGYIAALRAGPPDEVLTGSLLMLVGALACSRSRSSNVWLGLCLLGGTMALAIGAVYATFYVASPLSGASAVAPGLYIEMVACLVMPCAVAFELHLVRRLDGLFATGAR
jgi:hypothetical protein